jgi:SAM-dependent methyltransferase
MKDCGRVELEADEQVTFTTPEGGEYDVARKAWGFYATPSLNARLPSFGLRAAMSRNPEGRYFIFLVEKGKEQDFTRYLALERNVLISWLDNARDLERIEGNTLPAQDVGRTVKCICGGERFTRVHMYTEAPIGEVVFQKRKLTQYRRELLSCTTCEHVLSIHAMDLEGLYGGDYVDSTYGGSKGLRAAFDRIISLPDSESDNVGRVAYINRLIGSQNDASGRRSVLDVGSGLCVFLHRMKATGWDCTALDPDERAVAHAREVVGIGAIRGEFMQLAPTGKFDLLSFNKVLEHVENPTAMLSQSQHWLKPGGSVYIELPDAEAARHAGYGREEFFIDHIHVFSFASMAILANKAGFDVVMSERVREPSSKYTLRAILHPKVIGHGR